MLSPSRLYLRFISLLPLLYFVNAGKCYHYINRFSELSIVDVDITQKQIVSCNEPCATWVAYDPTQKPNVIEFGNSCLEDFLFRQYITPNDKASILKGYILSNRNYLIGACPQDYCNHGKLGLYISYRPNYYFGPGSAVTNDIKYVLLKPDVNIGPVAGNVIPTSKPSVNAAPAIPDRP